MAGRRSRFYWSAGGAAVDHGENVILKLAKRPAGKRPRQLVIHDQLLAYHPAYRWTQFRRGLVYTYAAASFIDAHNNLEADAVWVPVGRALSLYEEPVK